MAGPNTIGTLIVEMRSDTARFESAMGRARKKTEEAGDAMALASRKTENFAEEGLGKLIPGLGRSGDALFDFVGATSKGAAALQVFAKGFIVVTGVMAVSAVVQEAEHWLRYGETVSQATERTKEFKEEQEKLIQTLNKQREVRSSLERQLATLTGDQSKLIELEQKGRDAQIRGTFGPNAQRDELLARSALIASEARRKAAEQETAEQFKLWKAETDEFVKQLSARAKARQDFSSQFGQGGIAGGGFSVTQGVREAMDLRGSIDKELKDLAFARREGFIGDHDVTLGLDNIKARAEAAGQALREKFGGAFPGLDDAITQATSSVSFLRVEFEKAQSFIAATVPTTQQLSAELGTFQGLLSNMPAATESARGAISALSAQYAELAQQIANARAEAAALAFAVQAQ